MSTPLLLSVEEGAAQLRIGRSRMFDLIRRGEVLSVKVGGSRRIPYDSLRAYVDRLPSRRPAPATTCPPPEHSPAIRPRKIAVKTKVTNNALAQHKKGPVWS